MGRFDQEIRQYVNSLEIIDSHEHLPYCEAAREKPTDVLREYLLHYFNSDLISAGLSRADFEKVTDISRPLMERWLIVEPYWDLARYTGYGRALTRSVSKLYGIDKIDRQHIEDINDAFQKTLRPGHYHKVLKELSNIKVSLLDSHLDCDKTFFRSVYRLDDFIFPSNTNTINRLADEAGIPVCSFEDWLEACELVLDKALAKGAVALKSGLAYRRSLFYERVTRQDAEAGFNKVFQAAHYPDWDEAAIVTDKAFQDYMMHYILRLASRRKLTFQFHTGLQEGNHNLIQNSDPTLMTNLFVEYPQVKFDLFHIGYPYQNKLSALAKSFPNVFIDMCWAHIISPAASMQALSEWLDTVPLNKIIAFGGDYRIIDAVYGHQAMARDHVSTVLADKVEQGVFSVAEACRAARLMFYDNPVNLFNLHDIASFTNDSYSANGRPL